MMTRNEPTANETKAAREAKSQADFAAAWAKRDDSTRRSSLTRDRSHLRLMCARQD